MKYAFDFRAIARQSLRGRWVLAVLTGLAAILLGAGGADGIQLKLDISEAGANLKFSVANQVIYSTGGGINSKIAAFLIGGAVYIIILAIVLAVLYFILGSIIEVGYSRFNMDLVDGENASMGTLFDYFSYWKNTAATRFLQGLYIFLWSLLFVIPGILAGYSYAMTTYLLAENPNLTAGEALYESKQMMYGNRWRLFCLQFSFIGWDILTALTFGIAGLWVRPYKQAATAAFYREISGTERFSD